MRHFRTKCEQMWMVHTWCELFRSFAGVFYSCMWMHVIVHIVYSLPVLCSHLCYVHTTVCSMSAVHVVHTLSSRQAAVFRPSATKSGRPYGVTSARCHCHAAAPPQADPPTHRWPPLVRHNIVMWRSGSLGLHAESAYMSQLFLSKHTKLIFEFLSEYPDSTARETPEGFPKLGLMCFERQAFHTQSPVFVLYYFKNFPAKLNQSDILYFFGLFPDLFSFVTLVVK